MPIVFVETDPSGRASCFGCMNRIPKGSKRLVLEWQDRNFVKSIKYCNQHGLELLQDLIRELNSKDKLRRI